MKHILAAALAACALTAPGTAVAQPARGSQAPAPLSVQTTPVSDIVRNPRAEAALEAMFPEIAQYYDQIGDMTLAQVAPMSQAGWTTPS